MSQYVIKGVNGPVVTVVGGEPRDVDVIAY